MMKWFSLFSASAALGTIAALALCAALALYLDTSLAAPVLLTCILVTAIAGICSDWVRSSELARLASALEAAGSGDLNGRICRAGQAGGQIARAQHSFNAFMDLFEAFAREAGAAMEHAARGAYYRHIRPEGLCGDFRPLVLAVNRGLDAMNEKTEDFRSQASEITGRIKNVITEVGSSTDDLEQHGSAMQAQAEHSAELCAAGAQSAEGGAERSSSIARTTGELHSVVGEIASQAAAASEAADHSTNQLDSTSETLAELSQAAERIGSVIEAISQIAAQTSLLALNATIESARAGEYGRGFAVVAQEVKVLALQAGEQTGQIAVQVEAIQSSVRETVGSIGNVHKDLVNTRERVAAIAVAVEEQSAAVGEIASDVASVSQEVERAAGSARDAARRERVSTFGPL